MAAEDKDATPVTKQEERKEEDLPQKIEQELQEVEKENTEEEKVTEQHIEQMENILDFMWRMCQD